MFSHLVCRFLLVVLPLIQAVQIPAGNYPDFHKEFFANINHLTQIDRHNVEYIKPSIELGSFTIQTVIPANGPNYNQQNNKNEFVPQNKNQQAQNFANAYLPPANQFNGVAASDAGETNGYLPPYMQTTVPQDNYNSTAQVQDFNIPKPTFLQNLMRPLFENKPKNIKQTPQNLLVNNVFQQNQVHERKPLQTYQPTQYQNLPVNNVFQQFNPQNQIQRIPHQTYGPAPLINHNQLQANFVPERRPLQNIHDNTLNERRSFQPQPIQNHNQIQNQVQGNTLPERKPHQTYGPQVSTIERRDQSDPNDILDKAAFQQFKNQVDNLNKKLSGQSSSQQLTNPNPQRSEPERKPHQTYGPLQSTDNDKFKTLHPHTNLLQTNFLPKTDDEIEQNLNNDNSIHAEKFPPNEDSNVSQKSSKSNESSQPHQQNSGGIDTKYSSDGGYIY